MWTKRIMVGLLVVCLAGAGCQSTDSSLEADVPESASVTESTVAAEQLGAPATSTTPAVPTIENQAQVQDGVRLIEQGSEPRSELRFTFEDGQSEVLVFEQSADIVRTFGGEPWGSVKSGIVNRIQVDVETGEEAYRVNTVVLAAEPGANVDPAIEADVAADLEATVGLTSSFVMNDRGVFIEIEDSSEGLDFTGSEFFEASSLLSTLLPNEAVGVGAVWEVERVDSFVGLDATETTTYRITDISESIISLEIETAYTVDLGATIEEQGMTFEVKAWDMTTSGTVEIDLSSVVPTRSDTATAFQRFVTPDGDVRLEQTVVGQSSLQSE